MRIIQDQQGYMWFATFKGISKWDGKNFTNITKDNGLVSTAVIDFIEAEDGTIYLSNYGKGVLVYKNEIIDTINTDDGLSENFIVRIRLLDGQPTFFSERVQKYVNGKVINVDKKITKLKTRVGDILKTDDGLYAGSRIGGLYVKDKFVDKTFTENDGLLSSKVDLLEKDKYGYILIATAEGINKYKDGKITHLKYKGKVIKSVINDIVVGKDGTNYYASNRGLIIEKKNSIEILTTKNGLLENTVYSLEEDRNGNIYMGYEQLGVSIYYPERFSNYVSKNNSSEFIANTIIESNNNKKYFGTDDGITILSENGNIDDIKKIKFKDNPVSSLVAEQQNKLFVGTKNSFKIIKDGNVKNYSLNSKTFNHGIYDLEISQDGDVIIATRKQGLQIFTHKNQQAKNFINSFYRTVDSFPNKKLLPNERYISSPEKIKTKEVPGGIITYLNSANGLRNRWILDLLFTQDSSLVIAYHGRGVSFYKNGILKHISKSEGMSDGIVNTIYQTSDGTFWFGTSQGGITIYNDGVIDTINMSDGLSSNDIRGIVEIDNKFYVTTQNGLNILVPRADGYFVRQIKKEDGLLANECKRNSLLVDKQNNLWIGTVKGVSKFNPKSIQEINTPPNIFYSGLQIYNKDFPFKEFLRNPILDHDQNYLKFIFSGINMSAPKKIKYKYRLSGIDKEWVESTDNTAPYTSLDNGNYTFEVKAQNEWGYWSEPKTLSFFINPAWWETWWFYTLVVFAIGALIAFVTSYRYRHLLSIEKMRSKISADLHDSIGSGLSEISILSELLGAQIPNEFKSGLNNISTISRTLIESMSDIVWLVNPKKDTLKDLFKRLQLSYHEVLKYTDIDLYVENLEDLETIKLPMNFRQHLYLIFKEAINNAIKYSGGDLLNLKIKTAGHNLTVVFSDNGIGFEQDDNKMGNGLINMRNRAKEIGGNIEYFSEVGKGTTVIFKGKFSKQKI